MPISPSPLDLASLYGVKQWLGIAGTSQDMNLQACLSAASVYFLRYTGRGPRNWQNVTASPFNESVPYTEVYDGISGSKLFLRNFPINTVASLQVNNVSIQPSTAPGLPGWMIDDQGRAIVIRNGGGGASPQTFAYVGQFGNGYQAGAGAGIFLSPFGGGVQSVAVDYSAGFEGIPVVGEVYPITQAWQASQAYATGDVISDGTNLQQAQNSGTTGTVAPPWSTQSNGLTQDNTISWLRLGITQAPYTVTIQNDVATLSDQGVTFFVGGAALTKVNIQPTSGQYFLISPGNYLFAAADQGLEVAISYTPAGTPQDIVLAVIQMVSLNYMRRNWIGQRSIAMKDVGSTSYTLLLDPEIREVMEFYKRSNFSS